MEIKVKLSNLRTAPRKVRQVIDLVRGKRVPEARSILLFTVNKSARPVLKLLNSAVASAKHEFQLDESNLFISKIAVDEGPKLKRWHPMSRGRAYPIIKRSSHIALILKELNQTNSTVKEVKSKKNPEEKIEKPAVRNAKKSVKKSVRNISHSDAVGEAKLKRKITKKS
jgi:large subunit ribosomal protein L22